jgi:phage tail sheath protein FI
VATAPDPDPQYSYKVDTPGSDGSGVPPAALDYLGGKQGEAEGKGIYALRDETTFFNMLCLPSREAIGAEVWAAAAQVCAERRAMLIVDPPPSTTKDWNDVGTVADVCQGGYFDSLGDFRKNAVLYFPRLVATGDDGPHTEYPPCGVIAGIWARTDGQRGVWKAPAGTEATVVGATDLALTMNNLENGTLNVLGINCLRRFPIIGQVVWGARTMVGADAQTSEWKYLPVRRLALFLEESLFRGSQWIVFEPNDEPLWAQIRLNFGAFLHDMFRQGAFQGSTPKDAYFVKCDRETTTQNDIDRGIVNIVVGFAPLKPAEFVVIQLQQMAGQIEV